MEINHFFWKLTSK